MPDQLGRVVRYKPPALRLSFAAWTACVPFLILPVALGFLLCVIWIGLSIYQVFTGELVLESIAFLCLSMTILGAIACAMVFVTALVGDDQIQITRDAIVFPLFTSPFLRFRRKRLWSEITRVYIPQDRDSIVLTFRSAEQIVLSKNNFSRASTPDGPDELEKFLLACEVLATNAEVSSEVVALRDSLNEGSKFSYTEMWENELSNRFHATVFVPLKPDTVLRDKRLKVLRQLAFGGLSAVYLVQRDGKELMILKEAVTPGNHDEALRRKAKEMFEREALILAALDHPFIARVYDHFVEGDRHYLLLQRVAGQNLRQYVNANGPQSEVVVLAWARDVIEILIYLHEHEPAIIHRDITPENLIISEDGRVHLIDFGAANQFIGTVTGTVVGKQAFISPEQFRGKATPLSDIYALGGTLHFVLTGENPVSMSVCDPCAVSSAVSREFGELVKCCTQQESSKRPESARVLLEKIRELEKR